MICFCWICFISWCILGTLRSATATSDSTKTSPQNTTLLYHKTFVIIPSCSRHTLIAKYPKNELVREILGWIREWKNLSCMFIHSSKFGDLASSLYKDDVFRRGVKNHQHYSTTKVDFRNNICVIRSTARCAWYFNKKKWKRNFV